MSVDYHRSDSYRKLLSIQTILRYLLRRTDDNDAQTLDETLFMISHIEDIMKQLGALKGLLSEKALSDMMDLNIAEIETSEFTAEQITGATRVQVDNQAVADALLQRILDKELKRNKKERPMAVRSIVNTTFWSLLESGSVRWNKTKLKRQGIDLADYSEEGKEQHKINIKKK